MTIQQAIIEADATPTRSEAPVPREPLMEDDPEGDRRQAEPEGLGALTRFKFDLVRLLLWGWARCFSLSGLYLLGRFFGTIEYLIDYRRRGRVAARLSMMFPEGLSARERRRHTVEYFRRIRCDKMLYLIIDKVPREKLLNRIRWHGREHLDAALKRGRGVYVMVSHFGSHHVAGLCMALLGYRLVGVRDPKEAAIRRYVQRKLEETCPEAAGARMFHAGSFPRALYRELRENTVVCSALDVDRVRGERLRTYPVTIFGQRREFLTGTLQIALRCGAAVLQGFMISRRNYYYRWEVLPMLVDPDSARDEPEMVARVMQMYTSEIERHARAHPDHLMKI